MRVAFVTPRYGSVVGGAEAAIRSFAERLAGDPGTAVEVFTTWAADHLTWEEALPEGRATEGGVAVHRFPCRPRSLDRFPSFDARILRAPERAWPLEADRWIDLQGPSSPELVDAVAECDADVVVFSPYLYAPTVRGLRATSRPTVLAPAAHEEPLLGLPAFDPVFEAASAFAYYSPEERVLVEHRFGVAERPAIVTGIGIDAPAGPLRHDVLKEVGDRPYLLVLGRVEANKGSMLLARSFGLWKARRPGPLALVFAGPLGAPALPPHPDIVTLGPVDEETKWALLAQAQALVSPSPFESFSLVLMEAWTAGTPVVVNARSAVTAGHVARSGGGVSFRDHFELTAALDRLTADPDLRSSLGEAGQAYVEGHFRWSSVLPRYREFLELVAARG